MSNPPVQCRVLLIDDQPFDADLMNAMFEDQPDIVSSYLQDATRSIAGAEQFAPTVILLDLRMPAIDGLDVIRTLKQTIHLCDVPIIMLSSTDHPQAKAEGFANGAMDYLVKWPDRIELAARVRAHSRAYLAIVERDKARRALETSQAELLERTRQLADAQASLHEAQKMEAIGQLTGGIAHDFNNVLQLISGHLQLLKITQRADAGVMKRLDAASEGVRRGAELAARLLAFARRQPLQPVTVRADTLVYGMEEALRAMLGGASLSIQSDAAAALVSLDQVQFEKTLQQLVCNAAEAMGPSGHLAIDIVAGAGSGETPHGQVCIRLTDTGTGMDEEVQRRAFEPFYSTKAGRRAGIGLSLAFAFAKQSGGHMDLASTPGIGTRVTLTFPSVAVQTPAPTVLVVDDEAAVRVASVEVLRKLGYCVLEAADGKAALRLIRRQLPIDLLFTDVVLPGAARGPDLAQAAAHYLPQARVLFASGYPGDAWRQDHATQRAPLLPKPYRLEEMSRMVQQLLASQGNS